MSNTDIPINKNKMWIDGLYKGIDQLNDEIKIVLMKHAGMSCASDILTLCEDYLGRQVDTIQDLVDGWNLLRDSRNLSGKWKLEGDIARGTFNECGCPLIRSGLINLHPVQCLCSKGMIETVFTKVGKKNIEVIIEKSIGNGDDICEFIVRL